MQPTQQRDRPAYVTFEIRPEENRQASIEAGHPKFDNVDYAIITPAGSKDRVERPVSAWFAHLAQEVQAERFPSDWLQKYRNDYAAWKEGREAPIDGTPLVSWPPISPAMLKELLGLRVRTVEDLAAANEETLARLGMGARALKQQAVDWLATSNNIGKVAGQLTALQVKLEAQAKQIETLLQRNQSLEQQLHDEQTASKAA